MKIAFHLPLLLPEMGDCVISPGAISLMKELHDFNGSMKLVQRRGKVMENNLPNNKPVK